MLFGGVITALLNAFAGGIAPGVGLGQFWFAGRRKVSESALGYGVPATIWYLRSSRETPIGGGSSRQPMFLGRLRGQSVEAQ